MNRFTSSTTNYKKKRIGKARQKKTIEQADSAKLLDVTLDQKKFRKKTTKLL